MVELLKLAEVARRLGISEPTARRYVKSGKLPSVYVGGSYRVRDTDIEAFLRQAEIRPGENLPKGGAPSSEFEPSFNDVLAEERREPVTISAASGAGGGASANLLVGVEEHFDAIVSELRGAGLGEEAERDEVLASIQEARDKVRRLVVGVE